MIPLDGLSVLSENGPWIAKNSEFLQVLFILHNSLLISVSEQRPLPDVWSVPLRKHLDLIYASIRTASMAGMDLSERKEESLPSESYIHVSKHSLLSWGSLKPEAVSRLFYIPSTQHNQHLALTRIANKCCSGFVCLFVLKWIYSHPILKGHFGLHF